MAAAHSGVNHGCELGFCWYFLCGMKFSIPHKTHSDISAAIFEALKLKNCAVRMSAMKERNPSQSDLEYLYTVRWNGTSADSLRGRSRETIGETTVDTQLSGQVVRNRSSRLGN